MPNKTVGALADYVKAWLEVPENKATALALIEKSEGGVEGAILNVLKNAPKPKGLLGVIWPELEGSLASWVSSLVAKEGPEVVFDFVLMEVSSLASANGG